LWRVQRRGESYCVNVGVDVWGFMPIDIHEVLRAVADYNRGEPITRIDVSDEPTGEIG
jgi:hypothetical protein